MKTPLYRLICLFVGLGLAAATLGGCSPSGSKATTLPTVTLERDLEDYPSALIEGTLASVEADGIVYFTVQVEDGVSGLVFPTGYGAVQDNPVVLTGPRGQRVAAVGESVSLGGGEYPQGGELWGQGPQVDDFWIVSP